MNYRLSILFADALRRVSTLDLEREEGQGVTEYGIVLAFVAVALAAVLITLKTQITDFITKVGHDLANLPTNI